MSQELFELPPLLREKWPFAARYVRVDGSRALYISTRQGRTGRMKGILGGATEVDPETGQVAKGSSRPEHGVVARGKRWRRRMFSSSPLEMPFPKGAGA